MASCRARCGRLAGNTKRTDFWKVILKGSFDWMRYMVYGIFAYAVSPLLGDGKSQGFAAAAAVATEVSREVGRSVHDNLGGAGR